MTDSPLHRRLHAHGIHLELGEGTLPRIRVPGPHSCELYLQGAHLTAWQPAGQQPVLWMSQRSPFVHGQAIRGGIPICFPWFGPAPAGAGPPASALPAHGFARTMVWTVLEGERLADGRVRLQLGLNADEHTRVLWPHGFQARYTVTIGAELELELTISNEGSGAIAFSEALHTYFAVGDVHQALVHGLSDCDYIDKVRGMARAHELRTLVSLAGETDRIYLCERQTATIDDPVWKRRLVLRKEGSRATVVWNPWRERSAKMADMTAGGWTGFLCVESANSTETPVHLEPGARHSLHTHISIEPL